VRTHLDFNRFAVTIGHTNDILVLQDVSEAGTLRMSIAAFANALKRRTAVSGANGDLARETLCESRSLDRSGLINDQ
jgi:hypothetical protein